MSRIFQILEIGFLSMVASSTLVASPIQTPTYFEEVPATNGETTRMWLRGEASEIVLHAGGWALSPRSIRKNVKLTEKRSQVLPKALVQLPKKKWTMLGVKETRSHYYYATVVDDQPTVIQGKGWMEVQIADVDKTTVLNFSLATPAEFEVKYDIVFASKKALSDFQLDYSGVSSVVQANSDSIRYRVGTQEYVEQIPKSYFLDGSGRIEKAQVVFDLRRTHGGFKLSFSLAGQAWKQGSHLVVDPGITFATHHGGAQSDRLVDCISVEGGAKFYLANTNSLAFDGLTTSGGGSWTPLVSRLSGNTTVWTIFILGSTPSRLRLNDVGTSIDAHARFDMLYNPPKTWKYYSIAVGGYTYNDQIGNAATTGYLPTTSQKGYGVANPGSVITTGSGVESGFVMLIRDMQQGTVNAAPVVSYTSFIGGYNNDRIKSVYINKEDHGYAVGDVVNEVITYCGETLTDNRKSKPVASELFPLMNTWTPSTSPGLAAGSRLNGGSWTNSGAPRECFLGQLIVLDSVGQVWPQNTQMQFSSWLGGVNDDHPEAIAVNRERQICIVGHTFSPAKLTGALGFPVTKMSYMPGGSGLGEAGFATVFSFTGGALTLLSSTYLGGSAVSGVVHSQQSSALDVASSLSDFHVIGFTCSASFGSPGGGVLNPPASPVAYNRTGANAGNYYQPVGFVFSFNGTPQLSNVISSFILDPLSSYPHNVWSGVFCNPNHPNRITLTGIWRSLVSSPGYHDFTVGADNVFAGIAVPTVDNYNVEFARIVYRNSSVALGIKRPMILYRSQYGGGAQDLPGVRSGTTVLAGPGYFILPSAFGSGQFIPNLTGGVSVTDDGNATIVGRTGGITNASPGFPTKGTGSVGSYQGPNDGIRIEMDMLPAGCTRIGTGTTTPTCAFSSIQVSPRDAYRILIEPSSAAVVGDPMSFGIYVDGIPSSQFLLNGSIVILLGGTPLATPVNVGGGLFYVNPGGAGTVSIPVVVGPMWDGSQFINLGGAPFSTPGLVFTIQVAVPLLLNNQCTTNPQVTLASPALRVVVQS